MNGVLPCHVALVEPASLSGMKPKTVPMGWIALPGVPVQGAPIEVNGANYVVIGFKWQARTMPQPDQVNLATVVLFVSAPADAVALMRGSSLVGATAGAMDALKTAMPNA